GHGDGRPHRGAQSGVLGPLEGQGLPEAGRGGDRDGGGLRRRVPLPPRGPLPPPGPLPPRGPARRRACLAVRRHARSRARPGARLRARVGVHRRGSFASPSVSVFAPVSAPVAVGAPVPEPRYSTASPVISV